MTTLVLKLLSIITGWLVSDEILTEHGLLDPTANYNFTAYCQYYNYPVETHIVTTQDGYELTFFRIQSKYSTIQSGLPVVYLQHGLLDSSDTWIINDEADAPGFMIANRGYDVWLGNNRGNKYSLSAETLNSSQDAFWQFTWQDMAEYDLPAAFEYIATATGQSINYVGHSQGTTQMFAALSQQDPIVLKYLKTFCALGPVTYVNHQTSNLLSLISNSSLPTLLQEFDIEDFLPPSWASTRFASVFCTVFDGVCTDILGDIADADPEIDNYQRLNIILGHFPAGTSTLDILHWRQMVEESSEIFQMYDFGTAGDEQAYGQPTPPVYNLANVNVPVHMFVGQDDRLADPLDAWDLRTSLTGSPNVTFNLYPLMGHVSFLWGKNMSFMNDVFAVLEN